jgi:hypothetical protein
MALFTPLMNYAGYEHVLNAMPTFYHPNGNIYGIAIAKKGGTSQDLQVFRVRPGSLSRELVHTFRGGGVDAVSQIAAGGCVIRQDGSLWAWASAVPQTDPDITKTGFVGGYWDPIPGVDDPWAAGGVTLLPSVRTNPAWEARSLTAGVMLDIPATFGVPVANSYLVRLTMNAPIANVRARCGTTATPFFFTVNSQVAGVDNMDQGWVPGPLCYVSPAQGTPVIWLQVVGFA